jgi:hypothetical protein
MLAAEHRTLVIRVIVVYTYPVTVDIYIYTLPKVFALPAEIALVSI